MKKMYICEYPYVLYKVLIKAALNDGEDILDILITNRMDGMMKIITQLRYSNLFENVFYYDLKKLDLKYDMSLHKFDKNVFKQRIYELKTWSYFYKIAHSKRLKNIYLDIDFEKYDEIYCTDGAFVFENYLTANKIKHIMIEHARDVHIRKNYTYLATIFHYLEQMLDKYDVVTGIGIASKYCNIMEVNSDMEREQVGFLRNRQLRIWNVEEHIKRLSNKNREMILDIYLNSYVGEFNYNREYNLLLTNPLYIDGDVSTEIEQIQVYREVIRQSKLSDEQVLLIKPHPRDNTNYLGQINGIVIDSMISSEILCISEKLKLNKVITLYSSSALAFAKRAKEIIQIADNEAGAINFCKEVVK